MSQCALRLLCGLSLICSGVACRARTSCSRDGAWVPVNIGDAIEVGGYGTGGAVGDFDGDGCLELLISHGESADQPLSYFRSPLCGGNNFLRVRPALPRNVALLQPALFGTESV
jgi:hypothetical protein